MRSARILAVAVLALALSATLALAPTSASAGGDTRPGVAAQRAATGSTTVYKVAADDYQITSRVVKKRLKPDRPRQLVLEGKVFPRKGPVYIQRAIRCNKARQTCGFKWYAKVYLHQGIYRAVIDAPPRQRSWLWRAKVGGSYSEVWQTCTKRPKQDCKIPYADPPAPDPTPTP